VEQDTAQPQADLQDTHRLHRQGER